MSYVEEQKKLLKENYGYDYMDLLSDVAFKSIFTLDKKHTIIKILVKELLETDLKNIKVRHPGFVAKGRNKKGEEADYYFEVDDKKITIECNKKYSLDLFERNVSHLRRTIIDDDSFNTVQINFDGYDVLKRNKPVYKFSIKEDNIDSDIYKDLIQIFHINLSYFANLLKKGYNKGESFSLFDKMCMIFQTRTKKVLEEIVKGEDELMNVKKAIEDLNNNPGAWKKYSKRELEMITEAKENMAAGIKKGLKQGLEQGEKNKQIEIAKNLLNLNTDIDIIVKATGLSLEEVEHLKK